MTSYIIAPSDGWIRAAAAQKLLRGMPPQKVADFIALMVEQVAVDERHHRERQPL